MGPRHLCRGIHRPPRSARCRWSGFNGATASLPWNLNSPPRSGHPPSGFNGATASLPWNLLGSPTLRFGQLLLQWGHGISAVESPNQSIAANATSALQWGHGISAVESARTPGSRSSSCSCFNGATASLPWNPAQRTSFAVSTFQASMGPRHLCRGISGSGRAHKGDRAASMGPRHLCRGIEEGPLVFGASYSGFNGATASLPWNRIPSDPVEP